MFHLTTLEAWSNQCSGPTYVPAPFAQEGFIHCTSGESNVIDTANRYYKGETATMICLVIDPALVDAEIRTEDEGRIFPHIHGPLNVSAVRAVRVLNRDADGTFRSLGGDIA
jgi:uncharacterized protein (DUF952 family)